MASNRLRKQGRVGAPGCLGKRPGQERTVWACCVYIGSTTLYGTGMHRTVYQHTRYLAGDKYEQQPTALPRFYSKATMGEGMRHIIRAGQTARADGRNDRQAGRSGNLELHGDVQEIRAGYCYARTSVRGRKNDTCVGRLCCSDRF